MNNDYNFIIKVTTACPGNCKSCINRQANFRKKNSLNKTFDIQSFEQICSQIKSIGGQYICLSGGEPTLCSNLNEFITIAHNYNLAVRINTNGWCIDKNKIINWLNLGLDQIVLSIYGTNEDLVFKTRGNKLIYNKSMEALNVLTELKRSHKFIFIIQTIILKENYLFLPEILETAIKANADLFWPSYLEDAYNLPEIRMTKEDIDIFKKKIVPKMKNIILKKIKSPDQRKTILEAINKYYLKEYNGFKYHNDDYKCTLPGRHLTFYPNGTVDPCPGHEYFSSKSQKSLNYMNFVLADVLENNSELRFDYCKYCPQGEHVALSLCHKILKEHCKKDVLN